MRKKTLIAQTISIIGAGGVGSATAYTMMMKNLVSNVILIDINEKKEEGEVMDIADGLCFVETGSIEGADFKDAADSDIIIITAGLAQKPGETRLDLVNKNKEILKSIFNQMGKLKPTTIVIIISNPVDVLTYLAQEISGLPKNQVFGTGTNLDTARLKHKVAQYLGVSAQSVDGFVMGEHGDTEFVAWSTVSIGGIPVYKLIKSKSVLDKIEKEVKQEAYEIINRKGSTFYGIAMAVSDVMEAVLNNQHKILPLSIRLKKYNGVSDVCLGVPTVLGRSGVEKPWNIELNKEEKVKFKKSAKTIKGYIR